MAVLTSRSEEVGAESQWPWGGRRGRWIASFILIVLSRGTPREIEWRRRRSVGGEGEREAQLNSFPNIYPTCTSRCERHCKCEGTIYLHLGSISELFVEGFWIVR